MRSFLFTLFFALCAAAMPHSGTAAADAAAASARGEVRRLLEERDYDAAADILVTLHELFPDDRRIQFDCVAALSWAGRYQEAADRAGNYLTVPAPRYSLSAAALAFRKTGQLDMALRLYQEGQRRYPGEAEFVLGQILGEVDAGRYDDAEARLKSIAGKAPEESVVEARNYLATRRAEGDFRRRWDAAVRLGREGKYDDALAELRELKKIRPAIPELDYDIIAVLNWANRHEEVVAAAEKLTPEKTPDWLLRLTAYSMRETGRFADAEAAYRRLLAKDPDDVEVAEALAVTRVRAKKPEAAEELLGRYDGRFDPKVHADLTNILMRLRRDDAGRFMREDKYAEALARLDELKKKYPGATGVDLDRLAVLSWSGEHAPAAALAERLDLTNAPVYVRLAAALSLRETKHYEAAEKLYRALLRETPADDKLAVALAGVLFQAGKFEEVERFVEERGKRGAGARRALQGVEDALVSRRRDQAGELAREDRLDEALAILRPLREKYPERTALAWDELAVLSWNENHEEAARLAETLGESLDAAPEYVRLAAAISLREAGNLEAAERLYRDILATRPSHVGAADGLAATLQKAGRLDEAAELVERYRKLTPEANDIADSRERELLSLRRDRAGELAEAEKYREALAILLPLLERQPEHKGILYDSVAILSWMGEFEDAVSLGASGVDAGSAPMYVLNALAGALRKTDRLEEARAMYEAATRRFPGNADLAMGLALTLADLGEGEEGLAALDRFETGNRGSIAPAVARALTETRYYIDPPPIYVPPPRTETPYRAVQDEIVALSRDGKSEEASKRMGELFSQYPDDQYLLGDYIVLLGWNKEIDEAIVLLPRLDLRLTHDYVVAAGANALQSKARHYEAGRFIEKAVEAQKGNPELVARAAVMAAGGGDLSLALDYLARAEAAKAPGLGNRIEEARKAIGIGIESRDNMISLVETFDRPADDTEARSRRVAGLRKLGADSLVAEEYADGDDPLEALSEEDLVKRFDDLMARAARPQAWGEKTSWPRDLGVRESYFIDALKVLDRLQEVTPLTASPERWAAIGIAKMKAFYELNMLPEAVTEFAAVRETGVRISDGSLLAAAGAYTGLRMPESARELYRIIIARRLEEKPPLAEDMYEARKGQFWALLENEELEDALRYANRHYREGAAPNVGEALYPDDDWRKMDVIVTRALAHLYTGFHAKAAEQLLQVTAEAPAHAGALGALASTQAMRGLPRTARDTLHLAQIHEPSDIGLATAEAGAFMGYQDWRKAHRLVNATKPYITKAGSVKQLHRDWETHNLYELRVDVAWSRVTQGSSPNAGSGGTPTLEARLFSKPICYNWRVFGGIGTGAGDFQEGHARQTLYMGGLEFRSSLLTATLEARADRVRGTKFGLGLSGRVTPSDNWSFPFSFQLLSRDTPLRARYSGITADSASVGANYYRDESFSASMNLSYLGFSDDNRRLALSASTNHRVWTCYNRYVNLGPYLYTSTNSQNDDRPYFNPRHDFEVGMSATYGNLLWRRYERAWRHSLTLSAGNYYQKHYASDLVWNASYSQSLDLSDRLGFSYGVGYGRRVYDGDPEQSVNAWLSAVWRF